MRVFTCGIARDHLARGLALEMCMHKSCKCSNTSNAFVYKYKHTYAHVCSVGSELMTTRPDKFPIELP